MQSRIAVWQKNDAGREGTSTNSGTLPYSSLKTGPVQLNPTLASNSSKSRSAEHLLGQNIIFSRIDSRLSFDTHVIPIREGGQKGHGKDTNKRCRPSQNIGWRTGRIFAGNLTPIFRPEKQSETYQNKVKQSKTHQNKPRGYPPTLKTYVTSMPLSGQ